MMIKTTANFASGEKEKVFRLSPFLFVKAKFPMRFKVCINMDDFQNEMLKLKSFDR